MHSNTELPPPWHGRTPLLTHIWDWDGRSLMVLPDEDTLPPDLLRHQPGERDARWVRPNAQHPSSALEEEGLDIVESVYFMLRRLIHTDSDFARVALYAMVLDQPVIAYADRLVERLSRLEAQMLLPHARWLVREAVHREPLKLGMLLLGLSGRPEDLVDIRALARHDELSLFGVMAAELLCDDPTDVWWEMAHKAHGWGRIVTIERLADMVYDRPDIQTWLVRHGCRNNIGPEHLAWTCATAGALADTLDCSLVDRATLEGAALILETLATPHVCPGMVRYPHGPTATRLFLQHVEVRSDMAAFVPALQALVAWAHWPSSLDPDTEPWCSRLRAGWTDTLRSEVVSTATRMLSRAQASRLRV